MSGQPVYVDKLDYRATLMNHLREMSREAAQDGYLEEYEDLVDTLVDYLWPYIELDEKVPELEDIEHIGEGLDRFNPEEKAEYEKAARKRIRKKTRLCMRVMHNHDLLLKAVASFKSELAADAFPVKVKDGS